MSSSCQRLPKIIWQNIVCVPSSSGYTHVVRDWCKSLQKYKHQHTTLFTAASAYPRRILYILNDPEKFAWREFIQWTHATHLSPEQAVHALNDLAASYDLADEDFGPPDQNTPPTNQSLSRAQVPINLPPTPFSDSPLVHGSASTLPSTSSIPLSTTFTPPLPEDHSQVLLHSTELFKLLDATRELLDRAVPHIVGILPYRPDIKPQLDALSWSTLSLLDKTVTTSFLLQTRSCLSSDAPIDNSPSQRSHDRAPAQLVRHHPTAMVTPALSTAPMHSTTGNTSVFQPHLVPSSIPLPYSPSHVSFTPPSIALSSLHCTPRHQSSSFTYQPGRDMMEESHHPSIHTPQRSHSSLFLPDLHSSEDIWNNQGHSLSRSAERTVGMSPTSIPRIGKPHTALNPCIPAHASRHAPSTLDVPTWTPLSEQEQPMHTSSAPISNNLPQPAGGCIRLTPKPRSHSVHPYSCARIGRAATEPVIDNTSGTSRSQGHAKGPSQRREDVASVVAAGFNMLLNRSIRTKVSQKPADSHLPPLSVPESPHVVTHTPSLAPVKPPQSSPSPDTASTTQPRHASIDSLIVPTSPPTAPGDISSSQLPIKTELLEEPYFFDDSIPSVKSELKSEEDFLQ